MARLPTRSLPFLLLLTLSSGTLAAQQWQPMAFKADAAGIDENPLRGFVPYSDTMSAGDAFPHSMEWFYLPLSAVVTGPDTYRWSALEHQLNRIAGRGHQAIFRFYLSFPTRPGGIPGYLLDEGLRTFPYADFDNASAPSPSVTPDYSDPRLIDCLLHFIAALGARYDGDPRIAYLTAGLYGFWGEWHVNDHPHPGDPAGFALSQPDKDRLLQAYAASFHHTHVEVRQAAATQNAALLAGFGFHDDSFLEDTLGPTPWHFWPVALRAGAEASWRSHPTGGEVRPELQPQLFDAWPNAEGEDLATAVATIHPTWMLDQSLFLAPLPAAQRLNAVRADRLLGYTFFCSAARITSRSPGTNGSATVTLRIENRGIAPIAYVWPVVLEALDDHKQPIARAEAAWPLPTLMPGQTAEWNIPIELPAAASTLVLQIANPLPNGHPVAFANAEQGTVLPGWLTLPSPPVASSFKR